MHFSHNAYGSINTTLSGRSYWFKYADIKHMTPEQIRHAIGQLAQSGEVGGTKVMHVYTGNASIVKPYGISSGFQVQEYVIKETVSVTNIVLY